MLSRPAPLDAFSFSTAPALEEATVPAAGSRAAPPPDLRAAPRRGGQVAGALGLLAGAPGTGMRRGLEVGAGALGGALVAGMVGFGAVFAGAMPFFAMNPPLAWRASEIVFSGALLAALPGAALGAAHTLDRPAFPGSRQASAAVGALIGLCAGWGYGRGLSWALLSSAGATRSETGAEASAVVADLVGLAAALVSAWEGARVAWAWSDVCRPHER